MGQTIMSTLETAQAAIDEAWRTMLLSDHKGTSVKERAQDVALLKQAVAAYRLGDKDRARELLHTAAEINPDNPLIWLWRASVAASYKEAVSSLDRVLELDPTNAKARQWMDKLQFARSEALRKAGIEVPEDAVSARPTLVRHDSPHPATEAESKTQESEPAREESDHSDTAVEDRSPQAEDDRDPLLDLLEEREQEDKPGSPEDAERQHAEQENSGQENAEQQRSGPGAESGSSDDILQELLTGQQAVFQPDAGQGTNGLPAPIQPQSVQQSSGQGDDPFAYMRETSAETQSTPVPAADETPIESQPSPVEETDSYVEHTEIDGATESESSPEVGSVEIQEDAPRANPLVAAENLACPICEQMWTERYRLCPGCGSLTELSLVDEAPRHDGADRASLRAAAKRLEEELEASPTADAHRRAGLIYMNLRQSNDALAHLREAMRLDPSNQESRAAVVALEKRRLILAVDDSKTIQRMIASVLEKESYRVALAADGLQALARLDEEMPAIILLDITMPRMDGYQVCKVVNGNDATKHIPVIMLSGKDGFFDKVRGKMVGASNYITKPFDPSALLKAISKQIPS